MICKTVVLFGFLIIMWQAAASTSFVSPIFLAPPFDVFLSLAGLFASGNILQDFGATLWRTVLAFVISAGFGTVLGISIGYFRGVGKHIEMLLDFLRSIPPIALFPLFLLFFGIGELSKIAVGAFAGTMIVAVAAIYGTKRISRDRLALARKLGLRRQNLFRKFLLPESLHDLFGGYRLAVSICLVLVIVTEMFLGGAKYGLGVRLIDAHMFYNTAELYALIIIAGAIGYALNTSFAAVENRMIHWRGK